MTSRPRKLQASKQAADDLRALWGPDAAALLANAIDREIAATIAGIDRAANPSAVDELADLAARPHLSPILRRFARGDLNCGREAVHDAIQSAILQHREPPGDSDNIRRALQIEVQVALERAARGHPSPGLHDSVLERLHELDESLDRC